jgi:DNA mismatch endonuclease, patch repair protein
MDRLTPQQRSALMSRIRGRDTGPELAVRRLLHAAGYRYRLQGSIGEAALRAALRTAPDVPLRGGRLPGRPDLVFSSRRKVVQVHGCFWHLHDCPVGRRAPSSNTAFWSAKREGNRTRDARTEDQLRRLGWEAATVWECELGDPAAVLARLEAFLGPPAG